MMQEPPMPVCTVFGERAKILTEALNANKKIILIPDTVEGRDIIKFYVEDATE